MMETFKAYFRCWIITSACISFLLPVKMLTCQLSYKDMRTGWIFDQFLQLCLYKAAHSFSSHQHIEVNASHKLCWPQSVFLLSLWQSQSQLVEPHQITAQFSFFLEGWAFLLKARFVLVCVYSSGRGPEHISRCYGNWAGTPHLSLVASALTHRQMSTR